MTQSPQAYAVYALGKHNQLVDNKVFYYLVDLLCPSPERTLCTTGSAGYWLDFVMR